MPVTVFNESLKNLDLQALYATEGWQFQPDPDLLEINGVYSYDMDLFFEVKDLRQLYRWDSGMEFLAICELASGDFEDCRRDAFETFEEFKICVEGRITMLSCFNYLSED